MFVISIAVGFYVQPFSAISAYYKAYEKQQVIKFLNQYSVYDSRFNYESVASVDVDSLRKTNGSWTFENFILSYNFAGFTQVSYETEGENTITYTFGGRPYMKLNFSSNPPCVPNAFEECRAFVLVVATAHATNVAGETVPRPAFVYSPCFMSTAPIDVVNPTPYCGGEPIPLYRGEVDRVPICSAGTCLIRTGDTLPLSTDTGDAIHWHLYMFLATIA